jgi:hypothetical protein
MRPQFRRLVRILIGVFALDLAGAAAPPEQQFLLEKEGDAVDIRAFYGNPELERLPVRTLWTKTSPQFWVEQDGAMRQSLHEFVETIVVMEAQGVLLRPRRRSANEETFVPSPGSASRTVRRRQIGSDGKPGAWSVLGEAVWCSPPPTVGSGEERARADAAADPTQLRDWKSRDGKRSFRASLVDGHPGELRFRRENGTPFTAPLDVFSEDDQILLLRWIESRPWPVRYPATVSVPMSAGLGLDTVARATDAAPTGTAHRPHAYQTENFDFGSTVPLGQVHLQSIGVSFEATRRLIKVLPWGIPAPPTTDGRHVVNLFLHRNDYHDAGGLPNSAGIYLAESREFLVPFESIGLVPGEDRQSFKFKGPVIYDTLHHELTHQQMHTLLPFLPMWLIEGTADYIGNLPYDKGQFRVDGGPRQLSRYFAPTPMSKRLAEQRSRNSGELKIEYARFEDLLNSPFWPKSSRRAVPVTPLMPAAPDPMPGRYRGGFLLVYYFVHLDPDRSRLPRYFAAARRLALERSRVVRDAEAYQRRVIDDYNRRVLENHARVDAYNVLARAYNAALNTSASIEDPGTPIWAVLEPPPPAFRPPEHVAVFFDKDASFGPPALTWSVPGLAINANGSPGAPGGGVLQPPAELKVVPMSIQVVEDDGGEAEAMARNKSPVADLIRTLQTDIFGRPDEVARKVSAAYEAHGFPLPPPIP